MRALHFVVDDDEVIGRDHSKGILLTDDNRDDERGKRRIDLEGKRKNITNTRRRFRVEVSLLIKVSERARKIKLLH